ncbi:MAG: polysaccharide deacetylase family protein [Eubacteriales bacterium]
MTIFVLLLTFSVYLSSNIEEPLTTQELLAIVLEKPADFYDFTYDNSTMEFGPVYVAELEDTLLNNVLVGGIDISWVDPDLPVVAITFDDGPDLEGTSPEIYAFLKENDVHATFFLIGKNLVDEPEAIELILDCNSQVANHTYNHYDLITLPIEEAENEVLSMQYLINDITDSDDTNFVRLPFGSWNEDVLSVITVPIIGWSLNTDDWEATCVEDILATTTNIQDGDIVLFHDVHVYTLGALEILIPELQEKGFQFLTVEEMFAFRKIELEPGTIYNEAWPEVVEE